MPEKIVISKKIVGYSVKNKESKKDDIISSPVNSIASVSFLDKELPKRGNGPLIGETFKINNPTNEEASGYCTINFMKIDGKFRLAEIFYFSKDPTGIQFKTVSTRLASALARRTGRIGFMIDEMKDTRDVSGCYRIYLDDSDKKPVLVNGEASHVGYCIERACMHFNVMDDHGKVIDHPNDVKVDFRIDFEDKGLSHIISEKKSEDKIPCVEDVQDSKQHNGSLCSKCNEYAIRKVDGCETCMRCGDSKCE